MWSCICGLAFVGAALKYQDQLDEAGRGAQYGVYFAAVLVFYWGGQATHSVCHVTYCGVFGRWYFKADEGSALRKSFGAALTTSFGSICFGSFLIAAVRALAATIRLARRDAQQDGNAVCCVILVLLECVVSCLGDILDYFSEWAYVQCAVRGVSFTQAARITYSMMTCANLFYVVQDLLIDSVVNLGALLCMLVGAAAGAGTGTALGATPCVVAGAVIGGWSGLLAGGAAAGILSSGAKTILVLWAENPEPLQRMQPRIHEECEARILAKLDA